MRALNPAAARRRSTMFSLSLGAALFVSPYPFYFWSLSTGRLVAEDEWWARGMTHGPWRQEWEALFVMIPIYGLLLGTLVLSVSAVALAFKWRRPGHLLAIGGVACAYVAFIAIQAVTVYWTIR